MTPAAADGRGQPAIDPRVRAKLGALRRSLRLRIIGGGLARVCLTVVAAIFATLAIDYGLHRLTLQHMSVAQRLVVDLMCLAVLAAVAWRHLVRPMLVPMTDRELALVVEWRHPELADRLISSVEFADMDASRRGGMSALLIEHVVRQANEMAGLLRFGDALESKRTLRAAGLAALAVAVVAGFSAWQAELMGPWARRNVLLAGDTYPRRTHLTVLTKRPIRVVRGGSVEVVVRADPQRVVPGAVTFHMTFASAAGDEAVETVPLSTPESATYVKRFELVNEPFHFYVTGNDDRTADIFVEVAEPPQLTDLAFEIVRPKYMNAAPETVTAAQGALKIPEDSWVAATGLATKDLAEATIVLDDKPVAACRVTAEEGAPRRVFGRFQLKAPEPFAPILSLRLVLTDSEGFTNPRAVQTQITLLRDQAPGVQMAVKGIGAAVSRRARVPLEITAADDYGLEGVEIEWTVLSAGGKSNRVTARTFEPEVPDPPPFRYVFDMQAAAAAPDGNGEATFEVGDSLRLVAVAHDTMPAPAGPNLFAGNPVTLKIVSDEDLMASLVDSQRMMREQFRQAIVIQTESKERVETGVKLAAQAATLPGARQTVRGAADLQQQLIDRIGTIAGRFTVILEHMNNNRVGADADKRRIREAIIGPLTGLLGGALKDLAADLLAARNIEDGAVLAVELQRIATVQQVVLAKFDAILGEMIKVENAQQVERGLRTIIRMSEQVRDIARPGSPRSRPASGPAK